MTQEQNQNCCFECGIKFLTEKQKNEECNATTFHFGTCCVCGVLKSVTDIRHYNYLAPIPKTNQPTGEEAARKYATHIVSGPTPWEQFDNTKYKAFKAGWEARQGEAVEFGEWIKQEDYRPGQQNKNWYKWNGLDCNEIPLTTSQLYQLFLTSKLPK